MPETMSSFRTIRSAILHAPPHPNEFLHSVERANTIRTASYAQDWLAQVRVEAKRASTTPTPALSFQLFRLFEQTGDRLQFEAPYFDRRRRLAALAMSMLIDGGDSAPLQALIWEMCNEYTWSLPAHLPVGIDAVQANRVPPEQVVDLFAAETGHALAEIVTIVDVDPWLRYRVNTEIERRIFWPLFHDPRHFGWESSDANWAAVCAGCAGMAALALVDDRERLAGMIDRVVRALECFLEGFGDDGGCAEGVSYWLYGFGYYTYFAETLRAYTAGAIDLLQSEKIRRISTFPHVVALGDQHFVNFSDASDVAAIHPGLASRLAQRLGIAMPDLRPPDFHADHCYRWGHVLNNMLWIDPALLGQPIEAGSYWLPDLEWLVDRQALQGVAVAFAAKGGHNDEPHNHNDLGHFLLHIGGQNLLADLGAGEYTRHYFSAERYTLLHNGSQGHSVPIINGAYQRAGRAAKADVVQHNGAMLQLDVTRAYDLAELTKFERLFVWQYSEAHALLELTDTFVFEHKPESLVECFMSLHQPVIDAGTARWQGQHGIVTLVFSETQFTARVCSLPTNDHHGKPFTAYRLELEALNPGVNEQYQFRFVCSVAA